MGEVILWTSLTGYRNIVADKQFYAYEEKSKMNNIQISIPFDAICTVEPISSENAELQFLCFRKNLW